MNIVLADKLCKIICHEDNCSIWEKCPSLSKIEQAFKDAGWQEPLPRGYHDVSKFYLSDEPQQPIVELPIPETVIEQYWVRQKGNLTKCSRHDTLFSEQEEPCWQCYNEAQQPAENKEPCPNCKETKEPCACMRNLCRHCGNPVGNITFTCCDECWDKYPIGKKPQQPAVE